LQAAPVSVTAAATPAAPEVWGPPPPPQLLAELRYRLFEDVTPRLPVQVKALLHVSRARAHAGRTWLHAVAATHAL
jgi:hypothetical protein